MPEAYNMPLMIEALPPGGDPIPVEPWPAQPHGPLPDLPVDRAAIVEWFHDMVEARVPEGFPLPWGSQGDACHDPGPVGIGL